MLKNTNMEDKIFAISGGASGMGLATSKVLHARGACVAIGDIDDSALQNASTIFKDRASFTKVDVSVRESMESWIESTVSTFGRLDGAVNCAGIIGKHHGTRTVRQLEDEQWDSIMAVNLTGMMYCLRAELNAIQQPGSIVCISSIQGTMGFAKHAAYAASKHGVLGLVRSAAKEEGSRNVRVNAVTPGLIETPLMHKRNALEGIEPGHQDTPINRLGTAEECAHLIVWLLSDEASFVTGATYSIDGGWAC